MLDVDMITTACFKERKGKREKREKREKKKIFLKIQAKHKTMNLHDNK